MPRLMPQPMAGASCASSTAALRVPPKSASCSACCSASHGPGPSAPPSWPVLPGLLPCQLGWRMPTPGSLFTKLPSAVTVMLPCTSQRPVSWLKLQSADLAPGGRFWPVTGSGRFGNRTGTGSLKFDGPSVWMVMTSGRANPGGSGEGMRSGSTGAMPTWPPRVPSSAKSALGGTVRLTPASSGCSASTAGGKVTVVGSVALTGRNVPALTRGRKISPVPPARLLVRPGTAVKVLPTNG